MARNRRISSRSRATAIFGGAAFVVVAVWLAAMATQPAPETDPASLAFRRAVQALSSPNEVEIVPSARRRPDATLRTAQAKAESVARLRETARIQAHRALALANLETDPEQRRTRSLAAVEAWASVDPAEAITWSDAQPEGDRELALAAAFQGAVIDPAAATQAARELCLWRPERAGDYGQHLVTALTSAKAYTEAAEFASSASGELRDAWVQEVYGAWAEQDPAAALTACSALDSSEVRSFALRGLIAGWAKVEPTELMQSALMLPESAARNEAVVEVLPQWVAREPAAVATWLQHQDRNAIFDSGAAALASHRELASQQPDVATRWAASIAEPTARANALRSAAVEWARRDPEALERFIEQAPGLRETDRVALREGLNPAPDA